MNENLTLESILGNLVALYPNQLLPKETFALYLMALADVPLEDVWRAAILHMRTSSYFPTIAELSAVYTARVQSTVPVALKAWGEVVLSLKHAQFEYSNGMRRIISPVWTHPIIGEIVDGFGGFQEIYDAQDDPQSFAFLRGQFLKAYELARTVAAQQSILNLLPEMPLLTDGNGDEDDA